MAKEKFNSIMTEVLEQFLDTAQSTSAQWAKVIEQNPIVQKMLKASQQLAASLKERYPELAELGSQVIQGQKEAFRELSQKKSTSVSSPEDEGSG